MPTEAGTATQKKSTSLAHSECWMWHTDSQFRIGTCKAFMSTVKGEGSRKCQRGWKWDGGTMVSFNYLKKQPSTTSGETSEGANTEKHSASESIIELSSNLMESCRARHGLFQTATQTDGHLHEPYIWATSNNWLRFQQTHLLNLSWRPTIWIPINFILCTEKRDAYKCLKHPDLGFVSNQE